jgi:hypothetical protein
MFPEAIREPSQLRGIFDDVSPVDILGVRRNQEFNLPFKTYELLVR